MAYNSNDQRTVPGALQGVTAQSWAGPAMQSGSTSVVNIKNPNQGAPTAGANPEDARPGYLAVGQPGGNPSDVLVPGGQYSASDNNVLIVGAPAGLLGGGVASYYPGPVNAMVAQGWTSQQTDLSNVEGTTLHFTAASPVGGTHSVAYAGYTFTAAGGSGSGYAFTAPQGVPDGLVLASGGALSGTLGATVGTFTFLVEVTDSLGNHADIWASLVVA